MTYYTEQRDQFIEDTLLESLNICVNNRMKKLMVVLDGYQKMIENSEDINFIEELEDQRTEYLSQLREEIVSNLSVEF